VHQQSASSADKDGLDDVDAPEANEEVLPEEFAEDEEESGAVMSGGLAIGGGGRMRESAMPSQPAASSLGRKGQAAAQQEPLEAPPLVDLAHWNLELERVGPALKFKAQPPAKEWRTHLESSTKHEKLLHELLPPLKLSLGKISTELRKAVERIATKERHVNKQFEPLGGEVHEKQKKHDEIQTRYKQLSATVAEITSDLAAKADAIEAIKAQMLERNSSMTDTAPLRKIQSALAALKQEVADMELRIGVVSQTLLQSTLQTASEKHRRDQMSVPYGPSLDSLRPDSSSLGGDDAAISPSKGSKVRGDSSRGRTRNPAADALEDENEEEEEEEEDEEDEEEEEEDDAAFQVHSNKMQIRR
jgi:hypothetical protein